MLSFIHTEHEKILRQVAERLGLEIGAVRPKRSPLEAGLAINVEELRAALAEAERKLALLLAVATASAELEAACDDWAGKLAFGEDLSDAADRAYKRYREALAAAGAGGAL